MLAQACVSSLVVSKSVASFSTGSAGAFFGLGLRETLIVLTIVDVT